MRLRAIIFILLTNTFFSCDFRKSVSQDLLTGLATKGDGLSCDDVYLSDGDDKIDYTTYTYGSTFYVNFENIEGFQKENGSVFPGMSLLVLDQTGDTALYNPDLYKNLANGTDISPLLLNSHVTVGSPIHSNGNYKLLVHVWDKKGKGTFEAKVNFKVVPDDHIKVESHNISCQEIYLFSQERGITLTENKAALNEHVYLLFEGLEGVKDVNGSGNIGISIVAQDANGNTLLSEQDLAGSQNIKMEDIRSQIAPNMIISSGDFTNPVHYEVNIWDKNSDAKIKAWVELVIE